MEIFEPIEIGNARITNRIVRSGTWLAAATPTGEVTDELISRLVEYAEGGCALIVTGFAYISEEGAMLPAMIGVEDDSRIAGLRKLSDAVHAGKGDAKIFCQIVHTGIWRLPFVRTTYVDTFAADETTDPFVQMGGTGETCPAATEEDIRDVIGKWASAAKRCKEAGFDGVELHFAHGFGGGGWLSPLWNHRTDEWGGSLENRCRYGVEIMRAVRQAVVDWPVIAKINCEDGIEGGTTYEDMAFFAEKLVEAGIDALVVSGGSPAAGPKLGPSRMARAGKEGEKGEGYFAEGSAKLHEALKGKIPIIGVGGWRTPEIMEKHAGSTCDAFAVSRPLINDSGIISKWIADPNHLTGCVSCNKCLEGQGIIVCRKDEKAAKE